MSARKTTQGNGKQAGDRRVLGKLSSFHAGVFRPINLYKNPGRTGITKKRYLSMCSASRGFPDISAFRFDLHKSNSLRAIACTTI